MASVNISGGLWSSLILDQKNCNGDQEGFLIGEVAKHVTNTVTDTQEKHKKEDISLNIFSYFPCPEIGSFYNRKGYVNQVQLLSMLKQNYKHVVGWYKFRRMTSLNVSMRESSIHQNLLKVFRDVSEDMFLFGLFTAYPNLTISTHSTDYLYMTYYGSDFKPIPVTIVNLGNTENSDYRTKQNSTLSSRNGTYGKVLESFQDQFMDNKGQLHSVKAIRQMNTSMQAKLMSLRQNVSSSEEKLQTLSGEVRELRQKAEMKRKEKEAEQTNKEEVTEVEEMPVQEEPVQLSTPEISTEDTDLVPMETSGVPTETKDGPANDQPIQEPAQSEPVMSKDPFAGMINEMVDSIKKSQGDSKAKTPISERSRSAAKETQNKINTVNRGENSITEHSGSQKNIGRSAKYEQFVDENGSDSDSTCISSQNSNTDFGTSNSPVF
ncbi:BRISC complex subunit Abraxas 2-like isoform X1 [Ptychodera flava]|uniref:BRISC complex subunit Abraxas 2-like isoform X1 n=1 Tax=Ptychodera flava TaxID=63121 RepID=UPI00396A0EE8